MTDRQPPEPGYVQITDDEFNAIIARLQDRAARRWNRRRDWAVGILTGAVGLAAGVLAALLVRSVG
ncbi:hypothetical protein [Isoptericola sp. NPDC056605]|uniref:hypothetical protein n=1 Tax=Isoptericola sp. NPDC056605 TaxID=3345876 RepID=UPI003686365A